MAYRGLRGFKRVLKSRAVYLVEFSRWMNGELGCSNLTVRLGPEAGREDRGWDGCHGFLGSPGSVTYPFVTLGLGEGSGQA